jgi:hypothetical protein
MSQCDYIKYKKITTLLAVDTKTKQPPVLNSQDYSDYKEYILENTVANNKTIYRRITPTTSQVVLDMEKNKSLVQDMGTSLENCPSFLLCKNTNLRTNRVQMSSVYYTPTPKPLNLHQRKNASNQKTGCKCILDSVNTNSNVCSCKLGV